MLWSFGLKGLALISLWGYSKLFLSCYSIPSFERYFYLKPSKPYRPQDHETNDAKIKGAAATDAELGGNAHCGGP